MRRLVSLELCGPVFRGLVLFCAVFLGSSQVQAQSGDLRDQTKQSSDAARDTNQRKVDQFAEAAQAINGPAGNPECVWLGRRVVGLMWNDDLDTAFRHLDLYDRFGCPGGHVQAAFRCLTRFGNDIDTKVTDPRAPNSLTGRVHACWINPAAQSTTVATAPSTPAAPAQPGNATSPNNTPAPAPQGSPAPAK